MIFAGFADAQIQQKNGDDLNHCNLGGIFTAYIYMYTYMYVYIYIICIPILNIHVHTHIIVHIRSTYTYAIYANTFFNKL